MKQKYTSRSGLFLIELIISIFFFIVASAIIIQLFSKAHFVSNEAININNALFHNQNISEIFLGSKGDFETIKKYYSENILKEAAVNFPIENNELIILFDKNWKCTDSIENTNFVLYVVNDLSTTGFSNITITIGKYTNNLFSNGTIEKNNLISFDDKNCIHTQLIKKYIGGQ